MVLNIKDVVGRLLIGEDISGAPVYTTTIWNSWDDIGLLKGLNRKPNENNIDLRNRIVNTVNFNTTKQGLINSISNNLHVDEYNVLDKKIFFTQEAPLSYRAYKEFTNKTQPYQPPIIIDGDLTFKFPIEVDYEGSFDGFDDTIPWKYKYDFEKITVSNGDKQWTLWKDPGQNFYSIWEANYAPLELKFIYQVVSNDALVILEVSPKKLSRDIEGNITEVEQ